MKVALLFIAIISSISGIAQHTAITPTADSTKTDYFHTIVPAKLWMLGNDGYIPKSLINPTAVFYNYAYFSEGEKEKRKLVTALAETESTRVYVETMSDPSLREEIMKRFAFAESRYYELLVEFNKNNLHNQELLRTQKREYVVNSLQFFINHTWQ